MQFTITVELSATELDTLDRYRRDTERHDRLAALRSLVYSALLDRRYQHDADDHYDAINAELHETWYEITNRD